MDRDEVRTLLESVAARGVTVDSALDALATTTLTGDGFSDLGFARVDTHRGLRTGDPEVVYGAGKTPAQAIAIVRALRQDTARPALVTRAPDDVLAALVTEFADHRVEVDARAIAIGSLPEPSGTVCVVAAGTSDGPVAAEAAFVARVFGAAVTRVTDVGVAGIHRLIAARAELEAADVLIVVAGMEGALPSAVGGLVGTPIVAVPTSVGYGASFGGIAALLAMLNSCAPGVVVCNIDNGFGAGVFAARVARRIGGAK
ncbi:MAG: nickel pincer cofactor biosynthesis protein LarB [Mycobacteriales bacterium]